MSTRWNGIPIHSELGLTFTSKEDARLNRFVLLHCGFETPTPELMDAWKAWFDSVADRTVENVGFAGGREISASGTEELPWGPDSMCTR
jgi:hypothetical protein